MFLVWERIYRGGMPVPNSLPDQTVLGVQIATFHNRKKSM